MYNIYIYTYISCLYIFLFIHVYLYLGGGNSNIFWNFHPENWGRWTQFDDHIFQMGWFNHQLDILCRGHPKWWFSKGIPPKMAWSFRFRIYNKLPRCIRAKCFYPLSLSAVVKRFFSKVINPQNGPRASPAGGLRSVRQGSLLFDSRFPPINAVIKILPFLP